MNQNYKKLFSSTIWKSLVFAALICIQSVYVQASSHREAPLISNDPLADNVDLYAFRSPDNPNTITVIATYVPFQLPHGGPNYYNFGENIRYEIHVDNDASVPGDEITYRFTFNQVNEDPSTFFNIRLGMQNLKTTYTLERSIDGGQSFQVIVQDGVVPPNNIGPRSIESGVGLGTTYADLMSGAITTASSGETVFAGPTDDPFFVDLGGIFDLGNAPRQVGEPVDGVACMNVSAIAIQIPIATLLKQGAPATPANILDEQYVIGVWASASRPAITTLSSTADPAVDGDWIQVSRLGMPLTNEAVIPVGQKDFWNRISPYDEITETTLDEYFYNPELALYMDDDQFGAAVPGFSPLRIQEASLGAFDFTNGGDGLFGLKGNAALDGTALDDAVFGTLLLPDAAKPRSVDLWPIFHTGVPNVIPYQLATGKGGDPLAAGKPFINNFLPNGGDMLRLNMAVPPTPRDDANFSSLGLVQAAAIGLTVAPFNTTTDIEFIPNMDGFPNGRRLEDDVTRIELQAVGGVVLAAVGLWYDDYDPAGGGSPVTEDLVNVLSYTTGVETNDLKFTDSFPYLAIAHSGTTDCAGRVYVNPNNAGGGNDDDGKIAFVSSNTQSKIGLLNIADASTYDLNSFVNRAGDADGIYYNEDADILFQLNRTANTVDLYADVLANVSNGVAPAYVTSSSSDFSNGREIAVAGNKLIVAQDASDGNGQSNKLVVYNVTSSTITLDRELVVDINLWGIHLDGNTLYAIVDNSDQLAIYENIFSSTGTITADQTITIENMIRTHGLSYDRDSDLMLLTDVGLASEAADGAILTVENFGDAIADGMISAVEQRRVAGPATFLGNPVDIAYDSENNVVIVAERANSGGQILVFANPAGNGDIAPIYRESFAGASAVYMQGSTAPYMLSPISEVFASSNNAGMMGVVNALEDQSLSINTYNVVGVDADGIYYDDMADILYQLNRTDNTLNEFADFKTTINNGGTPTPTAISTSDFINGREIAVAGDRMVVAQDANDANGQTNKFYVYQFGSAGFELKQVYDADINLWGIHADVNTLYAIEDNTDRVSVYNNFFQNTAGPISADQSIQIEGIIRTHGITYDADSDLMLLTDVGLASEDDDGAFVVIADFTTAAADGIVSATEQVRVAGASTQLGNPVDIAYDRINDFITIAERASEGGKILLFANPSTGGDITPVDVKLFPGASAVYQSMSTEIGSPLTNTSETILSDEVLKVYPNPTSEIINIDPETLTEKGIENIMLIDATGKRVLTQKVSGSNNKVNVSALASGIYTMILTSDTQSFKNSFFKI